jgi:CHAT domain-containing protein
VHAIRDILEAAKPHGVGEVKVLELGDEEDPRQALEEQLKKEWHLVHFAGHGVSGKRGAGLVLAAEGGGVMAVSDLAKKMLTSQFFFISSCRSGDTAFVLPALEGFIPAVIGFRWRVDDLPASKFAVEFYRALFDRTNLSFKYLEYAFLKARLKLYESSSEDPTWVNPVLVMQLAEAEAAVA